jgi:hypothetical protein
MVMVLNPSNPGVYYANSVAKPGTSKHGDGLALDFKIWK